MLQRNMQVVESVQLRRNHFKSITLAATELSSYRLVSALQQEVARRIQYEAELARERNKLQDALSRVKKLSGLLPICANCKKIIRDTASCRFGRRAAWVNSH